MTAMAVHYLEVEMFFNCLIIGICVPLHVRWVIQVVRLLHKHRRKNPGTFPPLALMFGMAAQN